MPTWGGQGRFYLLALAGFRRLLTVRLIGQFGDGLLQVALASFVFFSPERAASPERIAAGFAVLLLPFCLVGPFAGVLLDRWSSPTALGQAASSPSRHWRHPAPRTSDSTSWRSSSWESTDSFWRA